MRPKKLRRRIMPLRIREQRRKEERERQAKESREAQFEAQRAIEMSRIRAWEDLSVAELATLERHEDDL